MVELSGLEPSGASRPDPPAQSGGEGHGRPPPCRRARRRAWWPATGSGSHPASRPAARCPARTRGRAVAPRRACRRVSATAATSSRRPEAGSAYLVLEGDDVIEAVGVRFDDVNINALAGGDAVAVEGKVHRRARATAGARRAHPARRAPPTSSPRCCRQISQVMARAPSQGSRMLDSARAEVGRAPAPPGRPGAPPTRASARRDRPGRARGRGGRRGRRGPRPAQAGTSAPGPVSTCGGRAGRRCRRRAAPGRR